MTVTLHTKDNDLCDSALCFTRMTHLTLIPHPSPCSTYTIWRFRGSRSGYMRGACCANSDMCSTCTMAAIQTAHCRSLQSAVAHQMR